MISNKCSKQTHLQLGAMGLVLRPYLQDFLRESWAMAAPRGGTYSGLSSNTLLRNRLTALHAAHSSSLQMSNACNLFNYRYDLGNFGWRYLLVKQWEYKTVEILEIRV